jgi:hypothetical protein
MGSYVVALLMLLVAGYAIYSWLRGERDIFKDDFAFGAVMLLVGVIGGAVLGLVVSNFLSDSHWLPKSTWAPLLVCFSVWVGWGTMVFRFLSSQSGRTKQ